MIFIGNNSKEMPHFESHAIKKVATLSEEVYADPGEPFDSIDDERAALREVDINLTWIQKLTWWKYKVQCSSRCHRHHHHSQPRHMMMLLVFTFPVVQPYSRMHSDSHEKWNQAGNGTRSSTPTSTTEIEVVFINILEKISLNKTPLPFLSIAKEIQFPTRKFSQEIPSDPSVSTDHGTFSIVYLLFRANSRTTIKLQNLRMWQFITCKRTSWAIMYRSKSLEWNWVYWKGNRHWHWGLAEA